jgi:hypothetical protein
MKQRFSKIAGLGLIEVLVAGAIAMVIIMGIGNMVLDSQKAQKNVQLGQNAGFFANQMAAMYTSSCPLVGTVYNSASLSTPVNQNWGTANMGGGSFVLQPGAIIPGIDLQIASFRMQALSDGAIYSVSGTSYQEHNAALFISFTKLGNTLGVKTGKEQIMGISLVTVFPTNTVVQCSLHGSVSGTSLAMSDYASLINQAGQTACESTSGTWIPATSTIPAQCLHPTECTSYGAYSTGGGTGASSFVNPITGGFSCPPGITQYKQGIVTTAVSCGKGCVRSVFTPVWACLKCGSGVTMGGSTPPDPCVPSCTGGRICQATASGAGGYVCADPNDQFP